MFNIRNDNDKECIRIFTKLLIDENIGYTDDMAFEHSMSIFQLIGPELFEDLIAVYYTRYRI